VSEPRAAAGPDAADPRTALASVAADVAALLRHHRDLGAAELGLGGPYLLGPAEALRAQEQALQGCRRCGLCEGRRTIVFGSGSPRARLVVIGEGPGADEDAQGLPFVGRAGQLLTRMLEAVQLSRDEVYICNAVKCRPPGNRNPEPDELAACAPFLEAQLAVLQPAVVLALGSVATQALLRTREAIGKLRGRVHPFRSGVLVPTFHPAFLLRNPGAEYRRMAWEDLKLARREYDARRTR
jgi:uracil-DNA glycosylase family 4